jgi:hypothetical protein
MLIPLNTEETFESAAQQVFTPGARVYEVLPLGECPRHLWPEGTYLGRDHYGYPVVDFDNVGIRTADFSTLRNLYR